MKRDLHVSLTYKKDRMIVSTHIFFVELHDKLNDLILDGIELENVELKLYWGSEKI